MSISTELREAAIEPNCGHMLMDWIPYPTNGQDIVFDFAIWMVDTGTDFALFSENERRMFLLFCSYAAEDEGK